MHLQFAELPVSDQDRAKAFYTGKLGCRVVADASMGGEWRWIELGFEGSDTALHFVPRENDAPSPGPVLVLVEDDVRGTVEALRAKDVEIVTEPEEASYMPGVTVAEFRDSEGNRMVLSERLG
ncbi:VOC family protein [Nocardiopsis metallicus]|uniref:Putative enzyme related to lactoylglutathione lyase n=1 Tax=Nocardiopsis metallicus TaxID=179819 RepID=A0A840VYF3_9ACTN|nr:VOC family protein [Nocardiopsis metallicus]MBB5489459.1 putative enzyme related to lactoylglutathione lyase [Nocardiopsis metallicus]